MLRQHVDQIATELQEPDQDKLHNFENVTARTSTWRVPDDNDETNIREDCIIAEPAAATQPKWRDKIPFISNDASQTKKLQNRISSKAMTLRKKFRRVQNTSDNNDKSSGPQSKPTDRKTTGGDIARKLKAFRLPKISNSELTKFKLADRMRSKRAKPSQSISNANDTPELITNVSTNAACDESHQSTLAPACDATTDQSTFFGFTSHFATVPRAAARIKKSIKTKLSKSHNASEESKLNFGNNPMTLVFPNFSK